MLFWLFWGFISSSAIMAILWVFAEKYQRGDLVDLGWTTSILLFASLATSTQPGDPGLRILLFCLVFLWGGRLILGLLLRLLNSKVEDGRYASLRESWGSNAKWRFFALFQIEAILALILAWPFFLIASQSNLGWNATALFGILITLSGLVGETLADSQLKAYKASPDPDRVCKRGLWKYSRHPNYFFEWLVWVGFSMMALPHRWGWSALGIPLLMYVSLRWVTGIPPSEKQALQSRGNAYRAYQQTTSAFFPLPPRKKSTALN